MVFCPNCGKPNLDTASHCEACSHAFKCFAIDLEAMPKPTVALLGDSRPTHAHVMAEMERVLAKHGIGLPIGPLATFPSMNELYTSKPEVEIAGHSLEHVIVDDVMEDETDALAELDSQPPEGALDVSAFIGALTAAVTKSFETGQSIDVVLDTLPERTVLTEAIEASPFLVAVMKEITRASAINAAVRARLRKDEG